MGGGPSSFKKKIRAARYIYSTKILQKKVPLCAILGLTHECQCRCEYCSVEGYRRNQSSPELDTQAIKKLIDDLIALGTVKINFFGGEPLLRKDIIDLVSYASHKGLFVFVDTNGILLNEERVRELKKAGVSCVLVHLSSAQEERHDKVAGLKGAYKRSVAGLMHCLKEKVPCVISTVATKESINSGDLANLIKFARKNKASGVRMLLPILSGKWHNKEEYLLSETERREAIKYLDPGFVYLESGFSYKKNKLNRIKCSAGNKETIYIAPSGDVHPCYAVPYSFGNIREDPIKDIINHMWNIDLFKNFPHGDCIANHGEYGKFFESEAEVKN
ncbi:MAG: radical SAM protein [Candidatus Omnitrophica bacterium]|nr:radical SAM protein [Candidatus Omnitrophota bacterium]